MPGKSYKYFWFFAVILAIAGIVATITYPDATAVYNVYDTYYVMACSHLAYLISAYFFLAGFAYWTLAITGFRTIKLLSGIHIVMMLGGLIIYPIYHLYQLLTSGPSDFLFDDYYDWENRWITVVIIIIILAQAIFIANITAALFRRKDNLRQHY